MSEKTSKLISRNTEEIRQWAENLGKSFTKPVLDYYLLLIKNTAIAANKEKGDES